MKRKSNLYFQICKLDHIRYIYDEVVSKRTKNKKKVLAFDNYYLENIFSIKYILSNNLYTPGKYNIFIIKEPKPRLIMSQSIFDKVINHLVSFYILKPVIEPLLIDSNVATRINKGTKLGVTLLKKYINEMKLENEVFYILKFDISKYFYSIDHTILKKLLQRKIKDKHALSIIFKIIDSTDNSYINETISNIQKKYKEIDLPKYIKGKGLLIGNMTSQILAIFYLNELDHFIKEGLHIKYYIRYMDDGILLCNNKLYLKSVLKEIKEVVEDKYNLRLNPKTKIYSMSDGVEFIGYRYILKKKKLIVKIRKDTKEKFIHKMKLMRYDYDKYKFVIGSYKGHLHYANSKNLYYRNVMRN